MKILFLYITSRKYGTGHFKRVVNYQNALCKYNFIINKLNLQKINLSKKQDRFLKIFKKFDIIIIDVSNKYFIKSKIEIQKLKIIFYYFKKKIGIIDGLREEQLACQKNFKSKFVIIPYFFTKKDYTRIRAKYFFGPEYLFNQNKIRERERKKIKNILITSGGSDLNKSILKIIKLLSKIKEKKFKLKILLGPFFKKEYVKKIFDYCSKKSLDFELINFKKNIKFNLKNTDLVITSSGLTKYDLLSLNIPLIVFCENRLQRILNKGFEKKNICLNLSNLNNTNNNLKLLKKFFYQKNFKKPNYKKYLAYHLKKKTLIKYLRNEF